MPKIDPKKAIDQLKKYLKEINNLGNIPSENVRKGDAGKIIDLHKKQKIELIKSKPGSVPDPELEQKSAQIVIELIKSQGKKFEITPKDFSKHDEEGLRDIILSKINAICEGEAPGETFVKTGKTDINLMMNIPGCILSAECKFWGGEQQYRETIDQHFGYLTWRQNYAIQITFSKNKGFSEVIEKAKEAATGHPTFVGGSHREIDESHFVTTNTFPEDSVKQVKIHHLLFNLYVDNEK